MGKGDQALLDALVRKGVLSEKEAEQITAETAQEPANTSAAPIHLGDWVQELSLGGDLRMRNQWDERTPMVLTNPLLGPVERVIPRNRWRFRLRLSLDFKLQNNFFGSVMLMTADNRAPDSKNTTYTGGYDLYSIGIARAFMGWNPITGLTLIAGKQANPFYTTDLIYDPDIDPQGLVERIDFDKFFNMNFGEPVVAAGKERKAPLPGKSLELALIAGQFVFNNNNANSGSSNFGISNLNQEGWEFNAAYNITDFLTASLTFYYSDALTKNLYGGFATGNVPGLSSSQQWPVARDRHDQLLQVNLLMKF
jgi:hypothetical protein